jgi:hypothetical protein
MEVIDIPGPQTLGLSEEQRKRLRDTLQSTLVETVRGPKAEIVARAKSKQKSIDWPKLKVKEKAKSV